MKKLLTILLVATSCYSVNAAVFTDNFDRGTGPLGPNWTSSINPGSNSIQSNEYLFSAPGAPYASAGAYTPATVTNTFSVAGDFRVLTLGGAGVAFNIHGITNPGDSFYALQIFSDATAFQIIKWTNGEIAGLYYDAEALSVSTNTTDFYHMTLNVTAPGVMNFTVTNNTTSALLYSGSFSDPSAPFSGGNAGFYMGGDQKLGDNFYVDTIPEPSSVALLFATVGMGLLFLRKRAVAA